ncbi:MAG: hypothetical protein HC780_02525 [Leptolyngbyaceae cyanobacterium CSU_1_3]|nr:hypothetical protein [Leptolyngbyaceae cyanobacterium CSU_1_3]
MNVKPSPAIKIALVAVILVVGAWLISRRFQIEVAVTAPGAVPMIKTDESQIEIGKTSDYMGSPEGSNERVTTAIAKPDPVKIAARQGVLRVSNRSDHPLRVALLSKQKTTDSKLGETAMRYETPAHWDFAPGEGNTDGLVVSLPDRAITLKKGDVVVAFAQDGSQRYWGPYLVGETDRPVWNPQKGEWQLILDR